METKLLVLEDYKKTGTLSEADLAKLDEAAAILKQGGLVAFPTETVYGLGGDAMLDEAAQRIYAAKGRPSDNPLIVHICDIEQLDKIAKEVPEAAKRMAITYWPGPLTMVFRKSAAVPYETTGGLSTVAVRFPNHPVAKELIARSGTVIAAPSANISGRPSTTTAAHCIRDLDGRIEAIVDGGACEIGIESTILDVTTDQPVLLRPGAVTSEMIEHTLGISIVEDAALKGPLDEGVKPKAPGMKYRHYAPKAPMVLVRGDGCSRKIAELLYEHESKGERAALICSEECLSEIIENSLELAMDSQRKEAAQNALNALSAENPEIRSRDGKTIVKVFGHRGDANRAAHIMFEFLRETDDDKVDFIVAEGCAEKQLGKAIMNRMKKAAAWQVIDT